MDNSTTSGTDASAAAAEFFSNLVYSYAIIAALTLWFYDYFLTLSTEVSEVWSAKLSVAQVLFYINRYLFPVNWIVLCLFNFFPPGNHLTCFVLQYFGNATTWVLGFTVRGIFILRTFAIYHGNWLVFAVLVTIVGLKMGLDIFVEFVFQAYVFDSDSKVCTSFPTHVGLYTKLSDIENFTALAFDTVVLVLTCFKTIRTARQSYRLGMKDSIAFIILRDGILYYSGVLALILAAILLEFNAKTDVALFIGSVVSVLADVLEFILVNRLVLNLRTTNRTSRHGGVSTASVLPDLSFAKNNFVGNLGAPLYTSYDQQFYGDEDTEVESETKSQNQAVDIIELQTVVSGSGGLPVVQ